MQRCLQPPSRNQHPMQFGKHAWNVHIRQSDFGKDAVNAALRKRQFLAAPTQIDPASALVLEIGNPRSFPPGIDSNEPEVFHLQVKSSPGISITTSEIKNPVHNTSTQNSPETRRGHPAFRAVETLSRKSEVVKFEVRDPKVDRITSRSPAAQSRYCRGWNSPPHASAHPPAESHRAPCAHHADTLPTRWKLAHSDLALLRRKNCWPANHRVTAWPSPAPDLSPSEAGARQTHRRRSETQNQSSVAAP